MKFLHLIINRINQYVILNGVIMLLFMIGGIINSCLFAYAYGNFRPVMAKYNSNSSIYKEYKIFFGGEAEVQDDVVVGVYLSNPSQNYVSDEDIQKLIDSGLFASVFKQSVYSYFDSTMDEKALSVSTCVYGSTDSVDNFITSGSDFFTGRKQVVTDFIDGESVGATVNIYGEEYEVIGKHCGGFNYYISSEDYEEISPNTNYIIAYSKERQHSYTNDSVYDVIKSIFPECVVMRGARPYERMDEISSRSETRNLVLIFFITQIAFVLLLNYLSDSLSRENSVSLIVGSTPLRLSITIFIEGLIISCLAFCIGLLIHYVFYVPVFANINIFDTVYYKASDYFNMLCIMCLISAIVLIPAAIKVFVFPPETYRRRND